METAVTHPTVSVRQAQGSWYDTKATYRFWKSRKVTQQGWLEAIASAQRGWSHDTVLVVPETSNSGFAHPSADELGYWIMAGAKACWPTAVWR